MLISAWWLGLLHSWKHDYKYLTELVLVLNHKAWQHQDMNPVLSELYIQLYEIADNYAIDNLKGYELKYFFEVTDWLLYIIPWQEKDFE